MPRHGGEHGRASASAGRSRGSRTAASGVCVTGLWSGAHRDGTQAEGPADVAAPRGRLLRPAAGRCDHLAAAATRSARTAPTAGDLDRHAARQGRPGGAREPGGVRGRATTPITAPGPGAKLGNPAIDSDPYAFVPYRGGFAVVDAGGNDLLWLTPDGKVSVLAVFPTRTEPLDAGDRRSGSGAGSATSIVGPGGAEQRRRRPRRRALRRRADGRAVRPRHGTRLAGRAGQEEIDLRLGVHEHLRSRVRRARTCSCWRWPTKGCYGPRSPGALVRARTERQRARCSPSSGLVYPTGLAVGNGSIYVSNHGLYPAQAPARTASCRLRAAPRLIRGGLGAMTPPHIGGGVTSGALVTLPLPRPSPRSARMTSTYAERCTGRGRRDRRACRRRCAAFTVSVALLPEGSAPGLRAALSPGPEIEKICAPSCRGSARRTSSSRSGGSSARRGTPGR